MPKYDYQCESCQCAFEIRKKISDPDPTVCFLCLVGNLKKVIKSAPGVEYKGNGWFKKDGEY